MTSDSESAWQDEEKLREMYHDEGLDQPEIAERFDVTKSAVCYWMKKHGIETRDNVEAQRRKRQKKPVPFETKPGGHERWVDSYKRKAGWANEYVYVHRLLYVAHHGLEAVRNRDVHHKNEIPWDNRIENLEAMTRADHSSHHASQRASS